MVSDDSSCSLVSQRSFSEPTGSGDAQSSAGDVVRYANRLPTASEPITSLGVGSHTVLAVYSGTRTSVRALRPASRDSHPGQLDVMASNLTINHDDAVSSLTYTFSGFVNGDTASVVSVTASLIATASSSSSAWALSDHVQRASTLSAPNYTVNLANGTLIVQPKILDVRLDYGSKSISLIGLNRDLPFINIRAVDVLLSDNVNVSSSMLQLVGVHLPNYSFSGFTYNSSNFDATWTLPSAIGVDRLMLSLDEETASSNSGIGPDIGADPFSDNFAVLPGDVNGDWRGQRQRHGSCPKRDPGQHLLDLG